VTLSTNDSNISVAHWQFDDFASIYEDEISDKKARLGSSNNWYPSYDDSDPITVRWAGIAFSGS